MNVKKTKFRRILIVAAAVVMVLGMSSVSFAANDTGTIDVYITVERTLVGNADPILEPTKVTVPAGSTIFDVLEELEADGDIDFTSTGSTGNHYVTGFKAPSLPAFNYQTDYEFWNEFDEAAGGMGDIYFEYGTTPSGNFLSEGNYCMLSGWIVSLNNSIVWDDPDTSENEANPTADTVLSDGDVVRWQYSFALARDCGYTGWDLLTLSDLEPGFYSAAVKSDLIKKMADNPTSESYANAMLALKGMDANQDTVDNIVNTY